MGFPKSKATSILSAVFKAGNKIALLTAIDVTNDTYTEVTGEGYERYTILSGDFTTDKGVTTTAQNILFGLAESNWAVGDKQVVGIAVFSSSGTLEYLGELLNPKEVGVDSVPVFKTYNAETNEGIRITLDVVSAVAANTVSAS